MLIGISLFTLLALAPPQQPTIYFAGQEWTVKAGPRPMGPGPNIFSSDPRDVWVDGEGNLHLTVSYVRGKWHSTEVVSTRSYGYGTYTWDIGRLGELDPNIVFGLFTWDNDPAHEHREIDIEFSRWGKAGTPNGQFGIAPYKEKGHILRYNLSETAAWSTHSFRWTPRRVDFFSTAAGRTVKTHTAGGKVPPQGRANVRMNLWLFGGKPPRDTSRDYEVVIEDFRFEPL